MPAGNGNLQLCFLRHVIQGNQNTFAAAFPFGKLHSLWAFRRRRSKPRRVAHRRRVTLQAVGIQIAAKVKHGSFAKAVFQDCGTSSVKTILINRNRFRRFRPDDITPNRRRGFAFGSAQGNFSSKVQRIEFLHRQPGEPAEDAGKGFLCHFVVPGFDPGAV